MARIQNENTNLFFCFKTGLEFLEFNQLKKELEKK